MGAEGGAVHGLMVSGGRRMGRAGLGGVLVLSLVATPVLLRTPPTGAEIASLAEAAGLEAPDPAVAVSIRANPPAPAPASAPVEPAGVSTAVGAPVAPALVTTTTTTTTTATTPPRPTPAPDAVVTADPRPAALPTPLEVAQAEVGGAEARYTTGWGFSAGFWCAKFISWVLAHAGVAARDDGPAALAGIVPAVETPVPGDLVFIDLMPEQGTGQVTHIGIVESVRADGSVATIEGNADSSGLVTRQVRSGSEVVGYGRPPAPTSVTVIPAPAAPAGTDCVWIEIGKPWLCDWRPIS